MIAFMNCARFVCYVSRSQCWMEICLRVYDSKNGNFN